MTPDDLLLERTVLLRAVITTQELWIRRAVKMLNGSQPADRFDRQRHAQRGHDLIVEARAAVRGTDPDGPPTTEAGDVGAGEALALPAEVLPCIRCQTWKRQPGHAVCERCGAA